MYIHSVKEVLTELDDSIKRRKPFSVIRFGDGGVKLLYSYLNHHQENLVEIGKKEGIPVNKIPFVVDSWRKYANEANFIDTVGAYFTNKFWPKLKDQKSTPPKITIRKLKYWKQLYQRVGINNRRYCNPELNYLSALRIGRNKNIIDILKNRKICVISKYQDDIIKSTFPFCNQVDSIKIVGQFKEHYTRCFEVTKDKIRDCAKDYDLFLVAGGELGRIYSGLIKSNGGRSFDIGFMLDYWVGELPLHKRLNLFLMPSPDNSYELVFTSRGRKYKEYI